MPEEKEDPLKTASTWLAQIPTAFLQLKLEGGEGNPLFLRGQVAMIADMVVLISQTDQPRQKLAWLLVTCMLLVDQYLASPADAQKNGQGVYSMQKLLGRKGAKQLQETVMSLADLKDEIGQPGDLPPTPTSKIREQVVGIGETA